MNYQGIAIIVKNKVEYEKIQYYFGKDIFHIDWIDIMETEETAMLIKCVKDSGFSVGAVGSAKYIRELNIEVLPFVDNFDKYLLPFKGTWTDR